MLHLISSLVATRRSLHLLHLLHPADLVGLADLAVHGCNLHLAAPYTRLNLVGPGCVCLRLPHLPQLVDLMDLVNLLVLNSKDNKGQPISQTLPKGPA